MKKEKKSAKANVIISILLSILLIPVIVINSILIIKSYLEPNHIPSIFGVKVAIVLSDSMIPIFEKESLIFIKEVDVNTLKVGDIICYIENGTAITHRIAEIRNIEGQTQYITKGDANNVVDRLSVKNEQIEGIYTGKIEGIARTIMFMQSTVGMVIFIICPIFIYLLWDILYRRKENIEQRRRTAKLEEELAILKAAQQNEKNTTHK